MRLEAARADRGLRRKLMEECRSKSIALLDRLRAGVQKALPEVDVLFDAAGTSTVDEDFFKVRLNTDPDPDPDPDPKP